ncbi:unnamed protein product [Tilletia controversa]|uniref:RRM domain-containing protein n=3 Tax=Tilletia TaxID=13289 RepID=A0A8X7N198_9BASI|nr:hypothetical protein CF336_g474 [Tilletia laevis]KAE8201099.1 hypothetical protein CF328_g2776 [Tilletia controversa]KAE8265409.1 hypothetical protein A4X03_0g283 [Tilletia caries]KAE8208796.1 hypothetical protein CF335_g152 [Tilletia laevis]KAE8255243.1 hypothetical protein A4X06_0g533 [Tilletia controversa]
MAEQSKRTIYVGGIPDGVDEAGLVSVFQPFGDIIEVQIPREGRDGKRRGFGFITFSNRSEAEDAIDNMHLNTITVPGGQQRERVINVTIAKPMRTTMTASGNRAVWASEDWIKQYGSGEEKTAAGAGAEAEGAGAEAGMVEDV